MSAYPVGVCTTPEAAQAVARLMALGTEQENDFPAGVNGSSRTDRT